MLDVWNRASSAVKTAMTSDTCIAGLPDATSTKKRTASSSLFVFSSLCVESSSGFSQCVLDQDEFMTSTAVDNCIYMRT